MRVYYYCSACKKENALKTPSKTKHELLKERGKYINKYCNHCGVMVSRNINRVYTKPNMFLILGGGLMGIVMMLALLTVIPTFLLLFLFPGIFAYPFYAWRKAEKKARQFNSVMIDDI